MPSTFAKWSSGLSSKQSFNARQAGNAPNPCCSRKCETTSTNVSSYIYLHLSTRVSFNKRVDMLGHFFLNHCIGENDAKFQSNTHILDPGIKSRCANFRWERSVVDRGGFSMFS